MTHLLGDPFFQKVFNFLSMAIFDINNIILKLFIEKVFYTFLNIFLFLVPFQTNMKQLLNFFSFDLS